MKKILLGLSVGLLASTSVAQIPMSKYVRTYSYTHTRGYFFQAPVDFTVTELQVPDELNAGSYVVALYKMSAAPPTYSASRAEKPVFYGYAKDAHTCLKVPALAGSFKKGDWLAVLGGAGNETGTIGNSYGEAGGHVSNMTNILGTPIALGVHRCLMQVNIGTNKGAGPISASGGSIGRVRMVVVAGTRKGASSCDYCPSWNGQPSLEMSATHPAIIGKQARLLARSGGAANTGALLAIGTLRGNVVVPGFGRLCILGILTVLPYGGAVVAGGVGTELTLGNIPAATPVGVSLRFQLALATATPTIPLSNGLELITGH
jgi:hypothetical protein